MRTKLACALNKDIYGKSNTSEIKLLRVPFLENHLQIHDICQWRRSVIVTKTTQLHLNDTESMFYIDLYTSRGMSEIYDGDNL